VENAALMPWLAATAFLHSVMIQEKRGMLKVWNMLLVILAFCLSIFGTFLTRSGVVSSVHSFTQSSIGPWFAGFISAITIGSLALVFSRLPLLRAKTRLESLMSREATFLYNNLLLVALCLTILWGVVWPLITEAIRGEPTTVAKPYYDFFLRVFGLPLLLLMGIGPLIAWRRASWRAVSQAFLLPAGLALAAGVGLVAAGAGTSIPGLIAYTFSAFVLASIVYEFVRGTRARRALSAGTWLGAFTSLVGRNRRRYGGYVVHAAIVLLAIGIAGSNAYQTVREQRLAVGQSMQVGAYTLVYRGSERKNTPQGFEVRGNVDVYKGGHFLQRLRPGKNHYVREQQDSTEMAIRSDKLTGEDLDLVPDYDRSGNFYLKALVKPLVNLVWLAGVVFFAGSLIALWPDAREQRRLAERYAPGRALVEA
jgi:cytochrome c-type biogenesis protein CcmF